MCSGGGFSLKMVCGYHGCPGEFLVVSFPFALPFWTRLLPLARSSRTLWLRSDGSPDLANGFHRIESRSRDWQTFRCFPSGSSALPFLAFGYSMDVKWETKKARFEEFCKKETSSMAGEYHLRQVCPFKYEECKK